MSLQFIMGPSGSGKSHYLYQEVTKLSLENKNTHYLFVVPEQFTMQTQKKLVMASPRKGILNVDVLSFERLAHRILEETGNNQRAVLDDIGKNFVIRKVAGEEEHNLHLLGSNLKKVGYITEMKSLISEFTQYRVKREQLEKMLSDMDKDSGFCYKLEDILRIYEGFERFLENRYITSEEVLDVLANVVSESKILKSSVMVFDGFTGFTPVQMKLIRELMQVCSKIMITINIDCDGHNPLFQMSDKFFKSVSKAAMETKIPIEESIFLYQKPSFRFAKTPVLAFLQQQVFRYSKKKYVDKSEHIQLLCGKNPKEEMDLVAKNIRRLVREKGYQYRQIAIITGDLSAYENQIEKVFRTYEIPIFMDNKRNALQNSFVEFIRSLLSMVEQGFTYESVFRYLRTDFSPLSRAEIDRLENYVLALGIRGFSKWREKWIRHTKTTNEEELLQINGMREIFVEHLEELMQVLTKRRKTVLEVTQSLYLFFEREDVVKKIETYQRKFASHGNLALEKEYSQIYDTVMHAFEQFVNLMGDEKISLKEYCNLLDAGLEEVKVGVIPPSMDQIVIGDLERTRVDDVKALFFVGLNDCYIPGKLQGKGLLSEYDRKKFTEYQIELAPGAKEKIFIQKFYLYLMMTKPSEFLFLSYCKTTSDGKAARPSYVISEIKKIFPNLSVQRPETKFTEQEWTVQSALSYLIEGLQKRTWNRDDVWKEVYAWYRRSAEWSQRADQLVNAAFSTKPHTMLTVEMAKKLYGNELENSVTRLEKFSECAYAHFLTYGLQLKEREEYRFRPVDLGTLFHSAIEMYAKRIEREGYTWINVTKEVQERCIRECITTCVTDYGNSILYSNARTEYMIRRLTRMLKRTVWALTKQLEKGKFVPASYELKFREQVRLDELGTMVVRGKIDRIDLYEDENEVAVKVLDYKTGTKNFELGELFFGLQMQLVVYLNAAVSSLKKEKSEKRIIPAGMFYYRMKDPLVDKDSDNVEQAILKELRLDGYVQADDHTIQLFDTFDSTSDIIPVGRTKNGAYTKVSKILSNEEFDIVSGYTDRKIKEIGKQILKGENSIDPYMLGDRKACDYCSYQAICGFDEKIPGYVYRELEKMGKKEAIDAMREEETSWGFNTQKSSSK